MSQTTYDITTGQWSTGELTETERYGLLSDGRRRAVLAALERLEGPVRLGELAEEIVAREGNGAFTEETAAQVEITLHHNHLPRMADLGVLDYDYESNRVDL